MPQGLVEWETQFSTVKVLSQDRDSPVCALHVKNLDFLLNVLIFINPLVKCLHCVV